MSKNDTIIKPEIIEWARKRARLTIEELAKKLHVSADRVRQWEKGETPIGMEKARALAEYAVLPFGLLFAKKIPNIKITIPDCRSIRNKEVRTVSPELYGTISSAEEKQDWYRDYLKEAGEEKLDFVGSITEQTPIQDVVKKLYAVLKCDPDQIRKENSTWEKLFDFLICQVENAGILFMRNGILHNNTRRRLDLEEFRGFVLVDEWAPLIFINGSDYPAAQLFTLIHELVHLLLGKGGITDAEMFSSHSSKTERFCNQAAAEFLVPEKELKEKWNSKLSADENIIALIKYFKVSSLVMISRAEQTGLISSSESVAMRKREIGRFKEIKARLREHGGGNFYATLKYRVSPLFAQTVIAEANSNRILLRDAFRLLGVKNMNKLQEFSRSLGMPS